MRLTCEREFSGLARGRAAGSHLRRRPWRRACGRVLGATQLILPSRIVLFLVKYGTNSREIGLLGQGIMYRGGGGTIPIGGLYRATLERSQRVQRSGFLCLVSLQIFPFPL